MFASSQKQDRDDSFSRSNQQRIEDLNKVLQGVQSSSKREEQQVQLQGSNQQQAKREFYFQRVKQLEDKIQKNSIADNQKFKLLNDQVDKTDEALNQECQQRDLIGEKTMKSLALVEKNFSLLLNEEYQSRKQNENEIFTEIDDKIALMKQEITRDSVDRRDYEGQQIESIEKELDELRFYFQKEKQMRDQNAELLIRNFGEEILRLQEFLSDERRISEDSYDTTLKLLQDLDLSISNDLDQEKNIRERSEKSMLRLLEETCQKVESSLLND